jgi:hypothetical protein
VPPADADDLRCIRCGYLLRGLPRNGACPECGAAIAISLEPIHLLRKQDPAWLGRVAEGFLWQVGAHATALLQISASYLPVWLPEAAPDPERSPIPALLPYLQVLLNWVAAWWTTTPEPGVLEPRFSLRRWVRIVTCVLPAAAALLFAVGGDLLKWSLVSLVASLAGLCVPILWYLYVRRLALRVPSAGLAFQSLLLLWAFAITALFLSVIPRLAGALHYAGVDAGLLFHLSAGSGAFGIWVWVGVTLFAIYFCLGMRRALIAARSASTASREAAEAADAA